MTGIISVNSNSSSSKYLQIIDSVKEAIGSGKLSLGDKIPSINAVCNRWNLSRDTVVHAYNELKTQGIISSAPGKGFYIASTDIQVANRIFVLFDELNAFKEDLYNVFLNNLGKDTQADIYFHHFNRRLFNSLIEEARGHYTTYVIMPAQFKNTRELLQSLKKRVIILDQLPGDLKGYFPAIYQDFEKDVFDALASGKPLLRKYRKLIMVHPGGKEPEGQHIGFRRFCEQESIPHEVIISLEGHNVSPEKAYFVIWDRDLVFICKEAKKKGLTPGEDIGIISYNDTALKEVVSNGITTISTDFKLMGQTLARQVHESSKNQIKNPSSLIIRNSL